MSKLQFEKKFNRPHNTTLGFLGNHEKNNGDEKNVQTCPLLYLIN